MSDLNNLEWTAIKNYSHAVMRLIWKDRREKNDLRPIGIWFAVYTIIAKMRKDPLWKYDIPPADTVKRRINYLARDGLWSCTYPELYDDFNPETGRTDLMSGYLPSTVEFPDEAEQIAEALRRGRFNKSHGKAQSQITA